MNYANDLQIVIDAGHGGWDNGASYNGRLEKDDNLRLALEVEKQLTAQGVPVLMTRSTDVFVELADRAAIANAAHADLFVSLHRNSYPEQTPYSNGVENFIYLTAPLETSGSAAQLVLDEVVNVGVQSNHGVSRGNYYVLRRTIMPSMLLEMGFIINDIDNKLFDEHLVEYAAAIAKGIMKYFGLEYQYIPGVTPAPPPVIPPEPECPIVCPPCLPCPPCPVPGGVETQMMVNQRFGLDMPLTGRFDYTTKRALTMALQMALNSDFGAGLTVDGVLGPKTLAAFPTVRMGQRGNVVFVIQALLQMNGYTLDGLDGIFGPRTQAAALMFQQNNGLPADGIVGQTTLSRLLAQYS